MELLHTKTWGIVVVIWNLGQLVMGYHSLYECQIRYPKWPQLLYTYPSFWEPTLGPAGCETAREPLSGVFNLRRFLLSSLSHKSATSMVLNLKVACPCFCLLIQKWTQADKASCLIFETSTIWTSAGMYWLSRYFSGSLAIAAHGTEALGLLDAWPVQNCSRAYAVSRLRY